MSHLSRRDLLVRAGALGLTMSGLAGCGRSEVKVPRFVPSQFGRSRAAQGATLRGVNSFTLYYASSDPRFQGEPQSSYDFLARRGHRIIRLPFSWGALQPQLQGPLNPAYLQALTSEIRRIERAGMHVVLDLHSFGHWPDSKSDRRFGNGLKASDLADVWLRLSSAFRHDPAVIAYDLTNEPDAEARAWEEASQRCVTALRDAGDSRLIWIEAVKFSKPESFPEEHGNPWIEDPAHATMYSAHQYFDLSGQYARGFSFDSYPEAANALRRLWRFTRWLEEHEVRGSIGEIGWPSRRRSDSWRRWNTLGSEWYQAADAAGLWVTYFSATSVLNEPQVAYDAPVNRFSPVPGISVAESQAPVIEAHPSSPEKG